MVGRAPWVVRHADGCRAGLSARSYIVTQLRRTYSAGGTQETIEVTYGDLPPSGARVIRHLTRDTLS